MKKLALILLTLVTLVTQASAQTSVRQSGNVTQGHVAMWISNGVIGDGGTAADGLLNSLGVTNNGGPGICLSSARPTAAGRNQLCLSVTTDGGAKISSYAYGTATSAGITFDINGTVQGFPTVTLPVVNDNAACFDGTTGTLKDCGFAPLPGNLPDGQIFVGNASAVPTARTMSGDCTLSNTGVISCPTSALLDELGSTRGMVLYRGASGWTALSPGTSGQALVTGGVGADPFWQSVAGTGTVTSVAAGTGMSFSTITTTGSVAIDKASSANYYAAASNKVVTTDILYPSEVTVTYGATTTFDFDTFINSVVTLTGNITTQTLSNVRAGKSGTIRFIQDSGGSKTTVWNSVFKWANGSPPTLSTSANAVDVLFYQCTSTTYCVASLVKGVS